MSTDVFWVRTNGVGEEVDGEMLGLKNWMVRTQKKQWDLKQARKKWENDQTEEGW